jgi:hypothetical protein
LAGCVATIGGERPDGQQHSCHDGHIHHRRHAIDDDGEKEMLRRTLSGVKEPGESVDRRSWCGSHFEALLSVDTTLTSSRLRNGRNRPEPRGEAC